MNRIIDIRLEALANRAASVTEAPAVAGLASLSARGTFFLETFGCQMNEHDSEKVAGLLLARGYQQVETPEAAD
jgi:2-methylthioadenine synthetase